MPRIFINLFCAIGVERRQVLPKTGVHRSKPGRIRRSWPLPKKVPLGGLRCATSSG